MFAMTCFILTLVEIPLLKIFGIDTSSFDTQQIITSGAILASSFGVYGWKERIFNLTRLKMELVKWQWEFKESHKLNEDQFKEIQDETGNMDNAIDEKIDGVITDTINEDVKLLNE